MVSKCRAGRAAGLGDGTGDGGGEYTSATGTKAAYIDLELTWFRFVA